MDDLSRTRHEFQKADSEISQIPNSMQGLPAHPIWSVDIFKSQL